MKFRNLEVTPKVKSCKLTADQWQLYTASMKCGNAARQLNARFKRMVNNGMSREEVFSAMARLMYNLSEYGAADSEPFDTLADLLDATFGREERW